MRLNNKIIVIFSLTCYISATTSEPYRGKSWRRDSRNDMRSGGNRRHRQQSKDYRNGDHQMDKYRRSGSRGRDSEGKERGGFQRAPPWLKGKAIGLWYRDRNKQKIEEAHNDPKNFVKLSLTREKENRIRSLLAHIETPIAKPTDEPRRSPGWQRRPRSSERRLPTTTQSIEEKYKHIEDSEFKNAFLQNILGSIDERIERSLATVSELKKDEVLDIWLRNNLTEKLESPHYNKMLEFRKTLPAFAKKDDILHLLRNHQVVVVSGETGCGKTTQIPQFILDDQIRRGEGSQTHIICTQPRRISAITVAERVADERAEEIGEDGSVGYQIRLERKFPRKRGSIMFCTTGILLQYMNSDPALRRVSHVILDEIHERDIIGDFMITLLRDILPKRPDLKVILMSATLNAEHFSKYYGGCPMLNIPGFTYPVTEFYLEDVLDMTHYQFPPPLLRRNRFDRRRSQLKYDKEFHDFILPHIRKLRAERRYSPRVLNELAKPESEEIDLELILSLIRYICANEREGAILVFLPGWDKISGLHKMMLEQRFFQSKSFRIIPLHSMMPTVNQKSVFERPPAGVRKIVISTNIAETSVTIDDIVHVIDSGKTKMKNFDIANDISTLKEEWISLANAKQRRGRAGRVQEGVCYHLYTKAREMMLDTYTLPEMVRSRLEEVILLAKVLQLGHIKPFLSKVMDPPHSRAIDLSLKLLVTMNALDDEEKLTPLGYHLAKLPLDPQTGKMILFGSIFSCVDPIFSVAASLSYKDAFVVPVDKEEEVKEMKRELAMGTKSDHFVLIEAMRRWEEASGVGRGNDFARTYFLSTNTLKLLRDMKKQFAQDLYKMEFLASEDYNDTYSNLNSANIGLIKAIICAGLYPNIAIIRKRRHSQSGSGRNVLTTPEDGKVSLHIRSINHNEDTFESQYLIYHQKLKSSAVYLHDTTMVYAFPLLFFGQKLDVFHDKGFVIVKVSDHIKFRCEESVAQLIKELRHRLDRLLEYKIAHPGVTNWKEGSDEGYLLRAIVELITHEDDLLSQNFLHADDDEYSDDDTDDHTDDDSSDGIRKLDDRTDGGFSRRSYTADDE